MREVPDDCEANFKAATGGRALPRTTDRRDPARRAFLEWRVARLTELWKHWDAGIRAIRSGARFIPNGPPDMKIVAELADIQFADEQTARAGRTADIATIRR